MRVKGGGKEIQKKKWERRGEQREGGEERTGRR